MRLRSTPLLDSFCGMDLKLGELSTLRYGLVKQLVRYIDPLARLPGCERRAQEQRWSRCLRC